MINNTNHRIFLLIIKYIQQSLCHYSKTYTDIYQNNVTLRSRNPFLFYSYSTKKQQNDYRNRLERQ